MKEINFEELEKFSIQVRRDIVRMVHAQNSGHPGGSLGCVEFFTSIFKVVMNHNKNFSMDDVPLTQKDINAIKAASTILHQFKNTTLFSQYEFAIQKILDRAISSSKSNLKNEEQLIQFESLPTVRGNENLELFLDAIKNKKIVQFSYFNYSKEEKSIRRVHPYLLKEYRNRWYLTGKSELRSKVITFGLDRIYDPIVLEQKYIIDTAFSADNYFKHSIGITVYNELPNEIIIEANPILSKYLESQPIHHSQNIKEIKTDGTHIFSYYLLITYRDRHFLPCRIS